MLKPVSALPNYLVGDLHQPIGELSTAHAVDPLGLISALQRECIAGMGRAPLAGDPEDVVGKEVRVVEAKCISSNREMIVRVLQRETGAPVERHGAPSFACVVGPYTLRRDGRLTVDEDELGILPLLASLELCALDIGAGSGAADEQAHELVEADGAPLFYPMDGHSGRSLLNLFSIISSRQLLLNHALAAPRGKGFRVEPSLMDDLLAHPPISVAEFLRALYGRDAEYAGVRLDRERIELTGFGRCPSDEQQLHRQLADRVMEAALTLRWAKAYTRNVRNRKYAFRTWLNAIGMRGPAYEEARRVMLGRLYGWTDRRGCRR